MRAILENPRYTGYAIFGRWTEHETLLNPTMWQLATSSDSVDTVRLASCGPDSPYTQQSCPSRLLPRHS